MEAYFEAKSKLFTEILSPRGVAVINNDSDYAKSLQLLAQARGIRVLTYGLNSAADLRATAMTLHDSSIEFNLVTESQTWYKVRVPVVSAFQIENILCAIGMVMAEGVPLAEIVQVLPRLTSAIGRMQRVGTTQEGAAIYVDYAHTPDALTRALQSLKAHLTEEGKLQVVFGCGGNRDTGKRAAMGAAAEAFADVVYVTDDNPRLEDASFIRAQVLASCPKGVEVPDRYVAIEKAIDGLKAKDVLLIAGKGHETGQIIMNEVIPFCDVQVAQEILARRRYGFVDRK